MPRRVSLPKYFSFRYLLAGHAANPIHITISSRKFLARPQLDQAKTPSLGLPSSAAIACSTAELSQEKVKLLQYSISSLIKLPLKGTKAKIEDTVNDNEP